MIVYFIGIHHKANMEALDSRTETGKIIDSIIANIKTDCKKLNLFPTEYLPNDDEVKLYVDSFLKNSDGNGIYVLLGKVVQKYLRNSLPNSISVNHPGWWIRYRRNHINNFVDELSYRLNEGIKKASEAQPG